MEAYFLHAYPENQKKLGYQVVVYNIKKGL